MRFKTNWLRLAASLVAPLALASCMQPDSFEVSLKGGDQAFKDKQYAAAESGYMQAIDFAEQEYHQGQGEADLVEGLKALAECYEAQEKFKEAEPLYLRASQLMESKVGTDSLKTGKLSPEFDNWIRLMMNLADTYRAEGIYDKAEATYERVLSLEKKLTKPDLVTQAEAQSELAETYAKQKRHKEAIPLFKSSLAILDKADGARKSLVMIDTIEDYAQTLNDMNQTDEAVKWHNKAKDLRAKIYTETK